MPAELRIHRERPVRNGAATCRSGVRAALAISFITTAIMGQTAPVGAAQQSFARGSVGAGSLTGPVPLHSIGFLGVATRPTHDARNRHARVRGVLHSDLSQLPARSRRACITVRVLPDCLDGACGMRRATSRTGRRRKSDARRRCACVRVGRPGAAAGVRHRTRRTNAAFDHRRSAVGVGAFSRTRGAGRRPGGDSSAHAWERRYGRRTRYLGAHSGWNIVASPVALASHARNPLVREESGVHPPPRAPGPTLPGVHRA